MQPHARATDGELGRGFAQTLIFGVLLAHSVIAVAADNVMVKVSKTSIGGYTCSDPQIGDAQGNQYMVCVDKGTITTTDNAGNVAVTWMLDTSGGWVFPYTQGVDIDAKGNKTNSNGNKKWTVTPCSDAQCTATNAKENGNKRYQYTINVLNGRYLLTFDPTIMN
jgi:hypothetical protein